MDLSSIFLCDIMDPEFAVETLHTAPKRNNMSGAQCYILAAQ